MYALKLSSYALALQRHFWYFRQLKSV